MRRSSASREQAFGTKAEQPTVSTPRAKEMRKRFAEGKYCEAAGGTYPESFPMIWFFVFFCVSGFCSILYEIIWLRLATAAFGVTSALVSIVLSAFMAGLGVGSWVSGYLIRRHADSMRRSALSFYASTELLIGFSAILVPNELGYGRNLLEHLGFSSSGGYYVISGIWVALALIPWCACMGATIPLAMQAIRNRYARKSETSFSYLYAANVLGATLGTILPPLIIELVGFRNTLKVGAILNGLLAATAFTMARRQPVAGVIPFTDVSKVAGEFEEASRNRRLLALLFISGLTSMGAELVWIRQFTPYLGTMVYAFASILGIYLIATFVGSWLYRRSTRSSSSTSPWVWGLLGVALLLPVFAADPQISLRHIVYAFTSMVGIYLISVLVGSWRHRRSSRSTDSSSRWVWALLGVALLLPVFAARHQIWFLWQNAPTLRVIMKGVRVLAIIPFCGLLGFVTPMLVDRWSGGNPERAGRAYAVNVVGCILGPLLSGFLLLPFINERWVLFICAVPWLLVGVSPEWWTGVSREEQPHVWTLRPSYLLAGLALAMVLGTKSYEARFGKHVILRDHTATSLAIGEGKERELLVNGRGMTHLTPITKMMAHLPLASLDHSPQNALAVCFGMGTTFRSMLSWQISTTAVELVPSVPRLFWYFHEDAQQLLASPLAHVKIDDGRRFLERTPEQFDVIVIDPPPPVHSAGSSLLYSEEFYSILKPKLRPGGILQQWLPSGDKQDRAAVARALQESFKVVHVFRSVEGWGIHFLASDRPLPERSPEEMARRMPVAAVKDMMEWGPETSPEGQFERMRSSEIPIDRLLADSPQTPAMHDDRPVNEYFLLRRIRNGLGTTLGGGEREKQAAEIQSR